MTTPDPAGYYEEKPMPTSRPSTADRPPRAVLAMHRDLPARLIDAHTMARLTALTDIDPAVVLDDFTTPAARQVLAEVEVIVSGWGCPPIDADTLAAAPRLRAVVHAAGSVKCHVSVACWERGIEVASVAWANALP
ncbi:hydroxyacid dehydrogenase, partial [Streptomyces californicus]